MSKYLKNRKIELLALKPNWDDNDAEPITEPTWNRLESFLSTLKRFPDPQVSPCPDGSINAVWLNPPFIVKKDLPPVSYMLVNVPPEGPIECYTLFTDSTSKLEHIDA